MSLQFVQGWEGPSLFILLTPEHKVFLFGYVDDMLITCSSDEMIEKVVTQMSEEISIWRLGDISYFPGIQVKRVQNGLHLNQQKYLMNLLKSCNFENLKPSPTPMVANQNLYDDDEPIEEEKEYRRIIGSL